jgi:hypothetical protein
MKTCLQFGEPPALVLCYSQERHLLSTKHVKRNTAEMTSSGTLRSAALVTTDVSEVLTRATRRNIPEDAVFHSHRRENLKSYIALTGWTV